MGMFEGKEEAAGYNSAKGTAAADKNYEEEERKQKGQARVCEKCGKEAETTKKCSVCKLVRYCSEECQLGDWKEKAHKKSCKKGGKESWLSSERRC